MRRPRTLTNAAGLRPTRVRSTHLSRLGAVLSLAAYWGSGLPGAGAEAPATPDLPPAAPGPVSYERDIRPVLERSCLRCHGPERPKGGLRLDTREAALRGGHHGVSIVPGQSASSLLIRAVARLEEVDEDLWMPPADTTPPLTREEVGLLRAWVDQGMPWGTSPPPPPLTFKVSPALGGITVRGNESVFRAHHWTPAGWNGGVESFDLRARLDDLTHLQAEGQASRDDYRVAWQVERRTLGFVRGGWEHFRTEDPDEGGYLGGPGPPWYALDRDLQLDQGRAWLDVGLAWPDRPRLTLGYEHQYRDGEKALTSWAPVTSNGITRNAFPTSKHIDEETHILKLTLEHEAWGMHLEDDFRAEWSRLRTLRTNAVESPLGSGTFALDRVAESQDSFLAMNAARLERPLTPWLLASGGYLYSHYDADASFRLDEAMLGGAAGFPRRWRSPGLVLERHAQVGNLNTQFGPWEGFSATVGVQSEWNEQRGFGDASFDFELPDGSYFLRSAPQQSTVDRLVLTEHLGVRFAGLPKTVLYAEGRLQQEGVTLAEEQLDSDYPLRRDTDTTTDGRSVRVGWHTSPWRRMSLAASYHWQERRTRDDHLVDVVPTPFGDFPSEGYSAFLRERATQSDEVDARLTLPWSARLKTILSYRWVANEYSTTTDPVAGFDPNTFLLVPGFTTPGTRIVSGTYDANIYSLNLAARPLGRLTLSTAFTFRDSHTTSAANHSPSLAAYAGRTYSLIPGATYAWSTNTDLLVHYSFSRADFRDDQGLDSLPLRVAYDYHALMAGLRHRFSERVSATTRYGFYQYDEADRGGLYNYTAHAFFVTLHYRFP